MSTAKPDFSSTIIMLFVKSFFVLTDVVTDIASEDTPYTFLFFTFLVLHFETGQKLKTKRVKILLSDSL